MDGIVQISGEIVVALALPLKLIERFGSSSTN